MISGQLHKMIFPTCLLCIWIFNSCEVPNSDQDNTPKETHIRYGFMDFGGQFLEYEFYDISETVGYLTAFPGEHVEEKVGHEILRNWEIEYRVHTSIEDAELNMVERLDMSNLLMYNIIKDPLRDGQIGDNCWYQSHAGVISFIRNNVFVSIYPNCDNPPEDKSIFEWLARQIDASIISSAKVYHSNQIPAPTINSVEVLSEIPSNWGDIIKIQVNATDPNSKQLYFRVYASGFGIVSETGSMLIYLFQSAYSFEDSTTAKVKYWVWNEDFVTSSGYVEFHNLNPAIS